MFSRYDFHEKQQIYNTQMQDVYPNVCISAKFNAHITFIVCISRNIIKSLKRIYINDNRINKINVLHHCHE